MISVVESRFLTSASSIEQAPPPKSSEVVFIGRSNVGKSTLINLIADSKGLAKSSSTPGKTQLINYFETIWKRGEERIPLWLVDLPGFGYAKVAKSMRQEWGVRLSRFLQERRSIKLFIQLIDARHPDLAIDSEAYAMVETICRGDQKILKVFTKMDKLNRNEQRRLQGRFPEGCFTSSLDKGGVAELRERVLKSALGEEA